MYFETPDNIPKLPFQPPDSIAIHEFLFGEEDKYGRQPKASSKPPFTCGITGKAYSVAEVADRLDFLARALSEELGLKVNEGHELDKVIGFFCLNTIDTLTVSWAAHRLNGVCCPISPAYTTEQVAHQLEFVKCKALFTSAPLIEVALEAAATAGIPRNHVYILEIPEAATKGQKAPKDLKTVDQLIEQGRDKSPLPGLNWSPGQGARQTAFLCSSSGTSGLPKSVTTTHHNVIANIVQFATFGRAYPTNDPQMILGVLPQSHAFALIGTSHLSVYRGDGLVLLPGFDLMGCLEAIQKYKIGALWMIPPFIAAMINAASIVSKYDITSVKSVLVGAASLSKEMLADFSNLLPNCDFVQGYGLTEATCIISATNRDDIMFGSVGYLLPGIQARLLDPNGQDVTEHDKPGELIIRSPSITPGYYKNEEAMKEMLTEDGWLRTGDLIEMRKSEKGFTHMFIVDRIKELIKVNGMQVAPAELQNFLLQHPLVADVAVIPVPNQFAGELPRAYIVKSEAANGKDDNAVKAELNAAVNGTFASYKRLAGGIEFLDVMPKTASGKVQRGLLKEQAKASVEAAKVAAEKPVNGNGGANGNAAQLYEFDSDSDED